MNPWEGALQTRYCNEHADLDGEGYGVIYETGPSNPAAALAFLNWRGGRQHLDMMRQPAARRSDRRHHPRPRLRAGSRSARTVSRSCTTSSPPRDAAHLHRGIVGAAQIAEAAGAHTIFSGHQSGAGFEPGRRGTIDSFAAEALA